ASMKRVREAGEKILAVLGPAVIHTGSAAHISELIRLGYLNVLFAGNALATHDIEQAIYGTSLGVSLERGLPTDEGHEHHLRSIATGNLLPAWVKVACVDINPATVTKLADRGSHQTVGIVTDAEPFLRALVGELRTTGA